MWKENTKKTFTQCLVNRIATLVFVDTDATCLFINLQFEQKKWWIIEPCERTICQAVNGSKTSKIGQIIDVKLRNDSKIIIITSNIIKSIWNWKRWHSTEMKKVLKDNTNLLSNLMCLLGLNRYQRPETSCGAYKRCQKSIRDFNLQLELRLHLRQES